MSPPIDVNSLGFVVNDMQQYPTCGNAVTGASAPARSPGKENTPPSEEISRSYHQHCQKVATAGVQKVRMPLSPLSGSKYGNSYWIGRCNFTAYYYNDFYSSLTLLRQVANCVV